LPLIDSAELVEESPSEKRRHHQSVSLKGGNLISSARLILWLMVNAAIGAIFCTSSGQEILAISAETFSGGLRVWIGQSLLVATGFHLLCGRYPFQAGDRRFGAAFLATLPLLVTAVVFRLAMMQYTLPALKYTLSAQAYFYSVYCLVLFACLATINKVSYGRGVKTYLFLSEIVVIILVAVLPHVFGAVFGVNLVMSLAACLLLNAYSRSSNMITRLRSVPSPFVNRLLLAVGPAAAIWILFGLAQNQHTVRNIDHDQDTIEDYSRWRVALEDSIGQWYAQKQNEEGVAVMLLVESAGGGLRAAYWTSATLSKLDQIDGFRDHLFAISSVSGASLGATLFRAHVVSGADRAGEFERFKAFYGHDFLGPLAAGWLFSDVISCLFPVGILPDRAEALERSWEVAWRDGWHSDAFGKEFRKLWPALPPGFKSGDLAQTGRWPHLILNGASLENGVVLATSDVRGLMFGGEQFPRVGEITPLRFPTSTAINNSARFPVIEPPGMIVIGKKTVDQMLKALGFDKKTDSDVVQDLVVDGGYVDNYGSFALSEVLDHVKQFNCKLSRERQRTDANAPLDLTGCNGFIRNRTEPGVVPIVIQITSDPDSIRTYSDSCACLDTPADWRLAAPGIRTRTDIPKFAELIAPITALDQMRQRSGVTYTADLAKREDVLSYFHFGIGPPYPRDNVLHREEPTPSLNWALSAESMRQLEEFVSQCDDLQAHEIDTLIKRPNDAADSTRRRRQEALSRASGKLTGGGDKFCR
jgi:hypothetical protein